MALSTGNKTCTAGLSKRVYDNLCSVWLSDMGYDLTAQSATDQQSWKLLCYSVAKGVVDEIQANAALSGAVATINPADSGLQRDPAGANPDCLGPAGAKTVGVTGGVT